MPLDRNIGALLSFVASLDLPPVSEGTVEQARTAFRLRTFDHRDPASVASVASVTDASVADVPVRIYRPDLAGPTPTVVFFHGGGWTIGDLDTHDSSCRLLCRDVDAVVVSVDYRLAPEHPFPAAVEDAYAVLTEVAGDLGSFGGSDRLAVAGDSAGGNLAAVCTQLARADGLTLAAQLLVYPSVDLGGHYPSLVENATGYLLTADEMTWFTEQYLPAGQPVADPRVSPLRTTDLAGLPPAIVVTAEYDPIRDEGNTYAAALATAGVPVVTRQFASLIHGFYGMEPISPAAAAATSWIHAQFAGLLAGT
jgi:acetyl esterase